MASRNETDEVKSMINSFRVCDLQSLLGAFKGSRNGRKQELLDRALQILKNPPPQVHIVQYIRKIRELYQKAQEEVRLTNGVDIQPQMQMQHTMAGNRGHQQSRNNMNPYASNAYSHQVQPSRGGAIAQNTMIYQGGSHMGPFTTNNYNSGIYNSQVNTQPMQSAPTVICNMTDDVQILTNGINHANITFRKLPFYKVKHQVLKPIILSTNTNLTLPANARTSANQEFQISFLLSCDMATELAMHRDVTKSEYGVQAQLRITAIDGNVTNANVTEYDDFLPLGLVIRVNNRQFNTLPPCAPTSRQGVESRRIPRPISITPLIKHSPLAPNLIVINWASEMNKTFIVSLNLVEKLTSEFLLNRLKERPTISVDLTKLTIREQYKRVIDDDDDVSENTNADDDDIATTIVRVSLLCPLAKFRMMYPAKGKNCSHLQCFDGAAYISLNEKKPMWLCPVCSRALYYDDLILDQYFVDVLRNEQLSDDCQEVQLFVDGTWKSYDEDAPDNNDQSNSSKDAGNSPNASPSQGISISNSSDVDDSVDRKDIAVPETINTTDSGPSVVESVVDLTCEDEEMSDVVENTSPTGNETNTNLNVPLTNGTMTLNSDQQNENVAMEISRSSTSQNTIETRCSSTPLPSTTTTSNAPSTVSNNSAYNSPGIISLDSPSPPTFPSSPQSNAIAALNIDDS